MAVVSCTSSYGAFLARIKACSTFVLLTDYDGTLAPFVLDRAAAFPFAGVADLLLKLTVNGVRVAVVSGRPAHDVRKLIGINSIEVWGSHGAERLRGPNEYMQLQAPRTEQFLLLIDALEHEGLSRVMELKPFGIAVHWRGLSSPEAAEVRFAAQRAFEASSCSGLKPFDFDGGIEFRPPNTTKAAAVKQIKKEMGDAPIAYLGDDLTDEDAFRALGPDDLAVLVRDEYRPTAAQLWVRPPDQLASLLQFLATMTGGRL